MKRKDRVQIIEMIGRMGWYTLPCYKIAELLKVNGFEVDDGVLYDWEKTEDWREIICRVAGISDKILDMKGRKALGLKLDLGEKSSDHALDLGLYLGGSYRPGEKQQIKQDISISFNEDDKDTPATPTQPKEKDKKE